MNQDKFSKILKSKGFYLSLLTGVLAIVAILFVYFNINGADKQKDNLVDLNNNQQQVADNNQGNANKPGDEGNSTVVNPTQKPDDGKTVSQQENDALLENDIEKDPSKDDKQNQTGTKKDDTVAVVSQNKNATKLSFDGEKEVKWPVSGDVIINYDMEQGVLFATLGQYKCSDAIAIQAKEGTKVKSTVKAKVLSVTKNEETGLTVTTDIGNGYKMIYGQLKNVNVKKGDYIDANTVIGTVAKPTNYYVVEGANLYFKMTLNDEPVNPLFYLD